MRLGTVVPGFSVLGFRALPGFRALCTGNQIWIYVINLPGFSALPGFKAPFHGDGQSALNPGTTVHYFFSNPEINTTFIQLRRVPTVSICILAARSSTMELQGISNTVVQISWKSHGK